MRRLALLALLLAAGCFGEPHDPLTAAACAGNAAEVTRLLAAGAPIDGVASRMGVTPLACSARSGALDAMKALLAHGADPLHGSGVNGWIPLIHAVHKRQPAAAALLLAARIPPQCDLDAALMMAAGYGDGALTELLLAHGANPRFSPGDGTNVLSNAVGGAWDVDYDFPGCAGHAAAVRALLARDPQLRIPETFWGRYAVRAARSHKCEEVVALVANR